MSSRDAYLKRKFGITENQYTEILHKQGKCCAICERSHTVFEKRLAVDHDHHTGRIRGLLCTYCNRYRVGRWKGSDLDILSRVLAYVSQDTGLTVPKKRATIRKRRRKK